MAAYVPGGGGLWSDSLLQAYSAPALHVPHLAYSTDQALVMPSALPSGLMAMPDVWQAKHSQQQPLPGVPVASSIALPPNLLPGMVTMSHFAEFGADMNTQVSSLPLPQSQLTQQPQPSGATIFFAGVTPIVATETLLSVFAQFGRVMDLNLFRPYKGCRTSKGCGLVVYAQHSEAAAALETLNGRYVWPGARSPMVIEWCDQNKQHKRKRAQPLTPALEQQSMYQQQLLPVLLPAPSVALAVMPQGNAGRLTMPGC